MDVVDRDSRGQGGWMLWTETAEDKVDGCCGQRQAEDKVDGCCGQRQPRTRWMDAVDRDRRGQGGWMLWTETAEDKVDGCCGQR